MIYARVEIKPCLQGLPYDSSKHMNQLPTAPVLSILQFTFSPGVNLIKPSQPASALWLASLEFVSTIPGFQGLHWGLVNQASPSQQVLVLIQWDSGLAWRRFQCSIGFRMLLGYVTETYNRCIQLSLPAEISASSSQCILELVSYQFSPGAAQREPLQNIKLRWESALLPLLSNDNDVFANNLLFVSGDWLQSDDRTENRYFAGLLFWKADMHPDHLQRLIGSNLYNVTDKIKELSSNTIAVVSSLTQKLRFVKCSEPLGTKDPVRPSVSTETNYQHPILRTAILRQYDSDGLMGPGDKDQVHLAGVAAERSGQRIAIGPAGYQNSMGLMNQHYILPPPEFPPKPLMDMITFRTRDSSRFVLGAFKDLRLSLWKLQGSPEMSWGTDNENAGWFTKVSLIIGMYSLSWPGSDQKADTLYPVFRFIADLGEPHANSETRAQFKNLVEGFRTQCGDAIQDFAYSQICSYPKLRNISNLEISVFRIPANEHDKRAFEYAYSTYLKCVHRSFPSHCSLVLF
jgi:hypothetical protein